MNWSQAVDALMFAGPARFADGLELSAEYFDDPRSPLRIITSAAPPNRDLRSATAQLQRFAAGRPDRVAVLARFDPVERDAAELVREALQAGAVGAFLHPWQETVSVTDRLLDPVIEVLLDTGRPLVLEGGFPWLSEPAQIGALAQRHPELTVVATRGLQMNMSGLAIDTAMDALHANPNLHCTTSATYRQDFLQNVVDEGLSDRLLFASLSPVLDERLERLRVDALSGADAFDAVSGRNAERIFRLTQQSIPKEQ
jgi:predicted TIM-barrel fold metal-dependent hydrolase